MNYNGLLSLYSFPYVLHIFLVFSLGNVFIFTLEHLHIFYMRFVTINQKWLTAMTLQLSVVTDAISGYVMFARSILLGTT